MFSYTVEKNASKQTFEMVCCLIESHFTGIVKEKSMDVLFRKIRFNLCRL